jgi:hypothetical protein
MDLQPVLNDRSPGQGLQAELEAVRSLRRRTKKILKKFFKVYKAKFVYKGSSSG